jgi:hypothetical protein
MIQPPTGLNEADFESIEAAVMETARGRWFLAEYARRCRAEDTARILSAVDRLENAAAAARAQEANTQFDVERAEALVRQLAEIVGAAQDGRSVWTERATGRSDERSPEPRDAHGASPAAAAKGSLEARLQALVRFDRLPLAQKLQLLG